MPIKFWFGVCCKSAYTAHNMSLVWLMHEHMLAERCIAAIAFSAYWTCR